ncbi:MAG: extracellular solute-binding protein [Gorillibacterium sp.]|nr:extracellular solute-binding protein [Gorillibacterium sp.]
MGRRKAIGMVLSLVLALSMMLTACGSGSDKDAESASPGDNPTATAGSGENTPAPKETVELKVYLPSDRPAGFDEVLRKVNEKLKADNIGASLNMNFLPWSDYANSIAVKMSAGEDFDMFMDAPWQSMLQMIASGSIIPLDDMVAARSELKQSIPDQMWEYNKFGDKIMGIPLGTTQGQINGFMIRKDLREKYGLPEIKTVDDLEKFFYTVKEKETDIKPFVIDHGRGGKLTLMLSKTANTADGVVKEIGVNMFNYSVADKKVIGTWDDFTLNESYERVSKYYKDGILSKNIAQEQNAVTLFNQGKYASTYYTGDGVEGLRLLDALKIPGAELEIFIPNADAINAYSSFQQWNFLCIPKSSKHAELAMDVANWLSIKENHDILEYGLEGRDWEAVGENSYKALSTYAFPAFAFTWRPELLRTLDTMLPEDKKWFDVSRDPESYTISPIAGFSFDAEKVKTEYAKITPLHDAYYLPLTQGVLEAGKGKETLKAKILAVGGQKVIDEIQNQKNI